MYLRRHMDSQGFVSLEFIAAFNRIKNLTTDIELLKLVCQQSSHVQYRTGEDGRDRLRRREGWEQWVLTMTDRDESAQNEGPKELHNPRSLTLLASISRTLPSTRPCTLGTVMMYRTLSRTLSFQTLLRMLLRRRLRIWPTAQCQTVRMVLPFRTVNRSRSRPRL